MSILPRADQRKVVVLSILQISLGALDLVAVAAIGLLGALSATGINSRNPESRVSEALQILQISGLPFRSQAMILGAAAVSLLVGRTLLSIFFTRRTLFFLSRRGARISANLVARLLSQPLLIVQSRSRQESLYAVTRGVELIVLEVIAIVVILVSEISLLFVMSIGLYLLDPKTAIGLLIIFVLIGYLLYRLMHVHAEALGIENSKLNIASNEKIVEVFDSYRESVVRNRRDFYAREIGALRFSLANVSAKISFMPYVSKYAIETTVILGAVFVGAVGLITQNAENAVATLSIFLAAGSRIAPAILRAQQGLITIRSALGRAAPTLELIEMLGNSPIVESVDDTVNIIHEGFVPEIQLKNVSMSYSSKLTPAISNISLAIPSGAVVGIVGPSGAGKTTLIDVLLGVLSADKGEVLISGLPPQVAVAKWPGAISYVPQNVAIVAGTIRENVALGFPVKTATDELVNSALKAANLDDFVAGLPEGNDTFVGENGVKLSGGQRQRLGIARAFFTKPRLLVMDEATSSLDGLTESNITTAIHAMSGSTTIIIVAHRLSTIRRADIVVYIAGGKVVTTGTFDEVRKAVPDFNLQVEIMDI